MPRVGIGFDVHRVRKRTTKPGMVLGGVVVDREREFVAHSDGDVLAHAIIDALLGACSCGNIGQLFPDSDPSFEGANSMLLLEKTAKRIREEGFDIINVDATLICEKPYLAGFVEAMRKNIAKALGLSLEGVNVKPKRAEGLLMEVGRGDAAACVAVALVERKANPLGVEGSEGV